MERFAVISHNSLRAIGFYKSTSTKVPYGLSRQGSQLITSSQAAHYSLPVPFSSSLAQCHRIQEDYKT